MLSTPNKRIPAEIDSPSALLVQRLLLWAAILTPPVFFIVAVQHSALLFPFWDHCELISYFVKLREHTLRISELWAPHNHARPLTFRIIVLLNGMLTDWDIRSEYLYLIAALVLTFVFQSLYVQKLCGKLTLRCLILISVLSVFSFSPAGHNNHWWSFMIVLDLAHLFIVWALFCISSKPGRWKNNLFAAIACWLATYTVSNGLVAFLTAGLAVQMTKRPFWRPDRFALFWATNTITVLLVYLPRLGEPVGSRTDLLRLSEFCLAYLGSPLASLMAFPFRDMLDVPSTTFQNAATGGFLLLVVGFIFLCIRQKIARAEPAALLFFCFSFFAVGSAILTGWGRANFPPLGVANANASRYTIFASYLIYSIVYAAAAWQTPDFPPQIRAASRMWPVKLGMLMLIATFFICSARSYMNSIHIYHQAHNFNQQLAAAFSEQNSEERKYVYPNQSVLDIMITDLKRMRIGPYRYTHPEGERAVMDILAAHKIADHFGVNGLRQLPGLGNVLFANPPSRFELQLPESVKAVSFQFGITDTAIAADPMLGGVEFRVALKDVTGNEKLLWSKTLRPVSSTWDRGIQSSDLYFSLSPSDRLIFETLPVTNPLGCWAYWRNITVRK